MVQVAVDFDGRVMFIPFGGMMIKKRCPKIGWIIGYRTLILLFIALWTSSPPLADGSANSTGTLPLAVGFADPSGTPPLVVALNDPLASNDIPDSAKAPTSPVILKRDVDSNGTPPLGVGLTDSTGTPPLGVGKPDTSFWQRPTGALFKSIIFPGWGQYSNRKYQKAAIFFTLESFFIFKSAEYFKKTRDRFDKFRQTEDRDDFSAYDAARTSRNKYYWYLAGTVFISMWDAFADAHIKPFEETKDKGDDFWGLEPGDKPGPAPLPLSLALTITF